ncbi:hypothetical protein [Cellulomonas shaoxiangyii]|uniref:Cip1-like core domain-containing protein n=1 Tax=Cellulomonas shaoxiangyii TaxID=2566013 RepID=A0A4P7SGC3_9CELL|nr:hypothetical protein [Cellulomonas shaoxiangyii]QCB92527.1 hypothetical protein E5225_02115 [Cellulomonas shaoxiangyii]TGY81505.1 hypothetical protein E5226_14220 [Cellulomonas shaoxiangyii]
MTTPTPARTTTAASPTLRRRRRAATVAAAALAAVAALGLGTSGAAAGSGTDGGATLDGGRGGHGPRTVCADRSLLFCEDFEALPTGGAATMRWGVDTRNGTLTVERVRTDRRGPQAKALRVHTADNGRAFMVVPVDPPDNSFYGRIRVRVEEFPTAPDWAHYTLVEASGVGAGVVRPVGGQYAPTVPGVFWGVGSDGGPTGDWTSWQESSPSVADRWQCIEWQLDASDNRVQVWIDGDLQEELTVDTETAGGADVPFVFPDVTEVKVGWQLYQGGTTPAEFDLWLDDVAFGTEQIGCRA